MSYRWTKNEITADSIVQSREFDNALGHFVDVMNGGMDRDNLPEGGITTNSNTSSLFSKISIFSNINADDSEILPDQNYVTPTPNRLGRLMYGFRYGDEPVNAGDGWAEATDQTVNTEEGMLEINWTCAETKMQYWAFYKDHSADRVALKYGQWQIRVDGNIVYTGPAQYEIIGTTVHKVCIPISKGDHQVGVYWRVPPQKDDDDQDQVVFNWWGGQLVCINRKGS
jgi:hypothetical protein